MISDHMMLKTSNDVENSAYVLKYIKIENMFNILNCHNI